MNCKACFVPIVVIQCNECNAITTRTPHTSIGIIYVNLIPISGCGAELFTFECESANFAQFFFLVFCCCCSFLLIDSFVHLSASVSLTSQFFYCSCGVLIKCTYTAGCVLADYSSTFYLLVRSFLEMVYLPHSFVCVCW